jgi:ABC-type lipoprotein export system ATPase subunit
MRRLNEQHKTTFVFSTHDPDVLQYARRVVKIRDGLIVDDATILPQTTAHAPTHAALAGRRVKNRQPRRRESSGARQKAK